jgi:diacylglycerol kinase (CTP)
MPSLPPFAMSRSGSYSVPATPRVISPSPTPSESREQDGYFGPVTRSAKKKASTPAPIDEDIDEGDEPNNDLRRARSKSRSPMRARKISSLTSAKSPKPTPVQKSAPLVANGNGSGNGHAQESNGHLSPTSANTGWSWRDFSRSPSPLGLIPIHRQWRSFVHRHEVPRKVLHVSIGFFVIWAYLRGLQTSDITPWLMGALIPIATVDYVRHKYAPFNRFYVRVMGALMRETEYEGWNGVIWYLLGAWIVLRFFPKDIGVMGVLLLSWCDTAASTVGRAYGRYTPRIRRGKSLAGSSAAFLVGVLTAFGFWGYLASHNGTFPEDVNWPFMFTGTLSLPGVVRDLSGLTDGKATIGGGLALGIMSLWTGLAASASEVVDIFGWDDNLTIPVLSGLGMWGFLKVFG